jgi:hypothetical protein
MVFYGDSGISMGLAGPGCALKPQIFVWYEQKDLSLFPTDYTPGTIASKTANPGSTSAINTQATGSVASPVNTTVPTNESNENTGLSSSAKAGIGVGVGISIILAVGFTVWHTLRRRRRRHKVEQTFEHEAEYTVKPELDAVNEKKPHSGAVELDTSHSGSQNPESPQILHGRYHELPESKATLLQSSGVQELDISTQSKNSLCVDPKLELYSSPGQDATQVEALVQASDSLQNPIKASFTPDNGSHIGNGLEVAQPKTFPWNADRVRGVHPIITPVDRLLQPVAGKSITPVTIEEIELKYLELEERRIQERKAQLLRVAQPDSSS